VTKGAVPFGVKISGPGRQRDGREWAEELKEGDSSLWNRAAEKKLTLSCYRGEGGGELLMCQPSVGSAKEKG